MKLFFSPASPFARKVMVVAHEVGLADRIERQPATAHPVNRDATIRKENPLGQIPTLVTGDGTALYDSRVICEYLDDLAAGGLFGTGEARWRALTLQALADGAIGAGLLIRYEGLTRPEERRSAEWTGGQMGKITDALERFETLVGASLEEIDIGLITAGCALGWLDFRFPDVGWRNGRPNLASWFARFDERPSMAATRPHA